MVHVCIRKEGCERNHLVWAEHELYQQPVEDFQTLPWNLSPSRGWVTTSRFPPWGFTICTNDALAQNDCLFSFWNQHPRRARTRGQADGSQPPLLFFSQNKATALPLFSSVYFTETGQSESLKLGKIFLRIANKFPLAHLEGKKHLDPAERCLLRKAAWVVAANGLWA